MLETSSTVVIDTQWGMYMLSDFSSDGPPFASPPQYLFANGMIEVHAPHAATILTATKWGPLRVTVETHDDPVPSDHVDEWSEVVEVSVHTYSGDMHFSDWDGNEIPNLMA